MNIAFFLISKTEIIYLSPKNTIRQALEKMEYHRYTSIPLIDGEGKYVGTITEGDLLWALKNAQGKWYETAEKTLLRDVPQRVYNKPVNITSSVEDLISLIVVQNFVPVIDDSGVFIGIVRRREILEYLVKQLAAKEKR